jgi:hypothetical protein
LLHLKFRVSCSHIGCKESVEIEVDWEDVSLDLNSKKIRLPSWPIYDAGWEEDVYRGYGGESEDRHYCPKHKRKKT